MAGVDNGSVASKETEPSGEDRIGVISLGSNDLHLLVATSDGVSRFVAQADHALLIELEERLDGAGAVLPPAALSQALAAVGTLVEKAHAAGAASVTAMATEALREATNGAAFLALLAATFGITAVEVTGEQEAALDYSWALFPPVPAPADRETEPHRLIIDSGGGSTQVVLGTGLTPAWATSLPIGAGSLTTRFLTHDPPKRKELQAMAAHVAALVDALPRLLDPEAAVAAVLMGGSADHLLRLTAHPERGIVTRADLEAALVLLHDKPAAKVARMYGMPHERARLLPAGATILMQLLQHYGITTAAVKAHGIRGGFVVCYARAGADWQRLLSIPTPTPATPRTRPRALATPAKTRHTPEASHLSPALAPQSPARRRTRSADTGK